ncbi:MAG TPA: metalloregulator ArsR/SmtB family transcription factor [Pyrinomonadaceae bacterium]|jgi:ArsR family transcriptional regulator|nr:metalloregulator ArsR/SmtB family transcription factor [Pyrinomonadaceae bacterium]
MTGIKKFDLELFFAALADGTRLRLLNLMRDGEVCVCFFADALSTNDPKISRHLAYLKRAGLVAGRRDGKWMHYKIVRPEMRIAAEILDLTLEAIELDPQMRTDKRKLSQVCCAPQTLVKIGRGTAKAEPQN